MIKQVCSIADMATLTIVVLSTCQEKGEFWVSQSLLHVGVYVNIV